MNFSIAQAVSVWAEFERAYRGESAYSGNVCEIYAYRLMPYVPGVSGAGIPDPDSLFYGDWVVSCEEASRSLVALLQLFQSEHADAKIEIEFPSGWQDLSEVEEWLFAHRTHVRITRAGS